MGMVIERRHVMGGQNLPYAAELEYIESDCTNSQYIDTSVSLTGPYEASLTFSIPTAQSQTYGRLMGVGNDNSGTYHYCNVEIQDSKLSAYSISNSDTSTGAISVTANTATTKQVLVLNNTSSTSNTSTFNGSSKTSGCTINYSKASVGSVYLFCIHRTLNSGGTAIDDSAVRFTSYKLYACSFKIGGELVRDFIPVLDNDGVACLYDKVSKKCFYNQGSGDFTAGPIISALKYKKIEYIENTGTQYIDTNFKPNQNTRVIADMQTVESTSYGRLFGCVNGTSYNSAPCFVLDYETNATGTLHVLWGTGASWVNISSVIGDYDRHIHEINKGVIYRDNTQVYSFTSTSFQLNTNLAIFAYTKSNGITSDSAEYLKGKLYSFKIYDNDVLVRDLIPIRVFDIGCLYDKVSKKAFGNLGTGAFTLGLDV